MGTDISCDPVMLSLQAPNAAAQIMRRQRVRMFILFLMDELIGKIPQSKIEGFLNVFKPSP